MTLHPSSNVDCSKKTEKVESGVKRTPQSAPKLSQRSRPWLKQKFSNLQTSAHNQFTHTLHMILISYLIWGSEQKPDQRNSHLQTELTQFPNQSWPQKDKEQKLPAQEQGTWNMSCCSGDPRTPLYSLYSDLPLDYLAHQAWWLGFIPTVSTGTRAQPSLCGLILPGGGNGVSEPDSYSCQLPVRVLLQ